MHYFLNNFELFALDMQTCYPQKLGDQGNTGLYSSEEPAENTKLKNQ